MVGIALRGSAKGGQASPLLLHISLRGSRQVDDDGDDHDDDDHHGYGNPNDDQILKGFTLP